MGEVFGEFALKFIFALHSNSLSYWRIIRDLHHACGAELVPTDRSVALENLDRREELSSARFLINHDDMLLGELTYWTHPRV